MNQILISLGLGALSGWLAKVVHIKTQQTAKVDKALGLPSGTTANHINAILGSAIQSEAQIAINKTVGSSASPVPAITENTPTPQGPGASSAS